MKRLLMAAAAIAAAGICCNCSPARAHGFAGDRFFPATLQTDDPFVADEMSLPTLTRNPTGSDGTEETDIEADIAKRLLPDVGITLADQWKYIKPAGTAATYGFDDLKTGLQYQLFVDGPNEFMGLLGLNARWGHTGRVHGANADDHTTLTPTFDFGKGFGDLPSWMRYLKPLAITGNLSVDLPTKINSNGALNQNVFNAGFAVEYSLEFLQHHVKDIGLSAPFDRMIPLVEITSATPINRGATATTGIIAPGIIWAGQYFQIGAEAIIPYGNSAQGHGAGGLLQLHFFLDDLFPDGIGRPMFRY